MRVNVFHDHRFVRSPDGAIWSGTTGGYEFWRRYLDGFDAVRVVARVRDVHSAPEKWRRADGPGVEFHRLPCFVGPYQCLRQWRTVCRALRSTLCPADAFLFRSPGVAAYLLCPVLEKTGHPYAVEVIGDPYDALSPGAFTHWLRPFFRRWLARNQRRLCGNACGCAYVTQSALQRRYPPAASALSAHYSSIELEPSAFAAAPRRPGDPSRPTTLITVGGMVQPYKAQDVLIDAMAACVRDGMDLRLVLVGDGPQRPALESREGARRLGDRLEFLGQLPPGEPVRRALDQAELFVLPSRAEALSRALIEAMARGLPCIGSAVGGISELLDADDLVPPGDVAALADKIRELVPDRERRYRAGQRNLAAARQYRSDLLRARRAAFYRYVRTTTQAWLDGAGETSSSPGAKRAA
jgi:glycosyltransferase involved in cell wall biosynthesis